MTVQTLYESVEILRFLSHLVRVFRQSDRVITSPLPSRVSQTLIPGHLHLTSLGNAYLYVVITSWLMLTVRSYLASSVRLLWESFRLSSLLLLLGTLLICFSYFSFFFRLAEAPSPRLTSLLWTQGPETRYRIQPKLLPSLPYQGTYSDA